MSRTDTAIRDRLKATREQVQQLRQERAEALKERDAARDAFANATIDGSITENPEFRAAEEAVKRVGEIEDKINDTKATEEGLLRLVGGSSGYSDNSTGGAGGGAADPTRAYNGWNGHRLIADSEEYQHMRQAGLFNSDSTPLGTHFLGEIAGREEAAAFLSPRQAYLPGAAAGSIQSSIGITPPDIRGIVQPLLRPLTLLDIIPAGTTDSNLVEYVQVTGLPVGAAETAELATKPQLGLSTVDATAPVRTIAGWIKLSRQSLDDVAGLGTLINSLLPYEVRRRIEAQILAGDGSGQNLLGLLNTTGVNEPAAVTGDNAADAILRAMTLVHLSGSIPNFVAVNPLTWQDLLLLRTDIGGANTGSYLLGGPGTMAAATIWGMAITPSLIVNQYTPLVGDSMGATLLVREGVNVKTSDSDQDDFVKNRVTVLAEARVAFPVWRPSAFSVANIPHA